MTLDCPFPYFGGKSKIADPVWARFGDVANYVEPFFGSGAVLLRRPSWHKGHIETVTDADGMISNFWRSVQHDPEATVHYADYPLIESDLHARHAWLLGQKESLTVKLEGNMDYFDAKIAGYWAWGMSCWIAGGFCSGNGPWVQVNGELVKGSGGICKERPVLTCSQGVNSGKGLDGGIYQWFADLSARLRRVRVCTGDWKRIMGPAVTFGIGLTGVFLDPPYSQSERDSGLYAEESDVATDVARWARENGDNPLLRIALCGYDSEHEMPGSWSIYHWKAKGGYGSQGEGRGRENAKRETIWFSPSCLKHEQGKLL